MTQNVGENDKALRLAVGFALIIWGILTQNALGILGLIGLVTAISGYCPIYAVLGVSTAAKPVKKTVAKKVVAKKTVAKKTATKRRK